MANNSFMSKEEVDLKYSEELLRGAGTFGVVKTLCVKKEYENTNLRKRIVMKIIKHTTSATREIKNLKALLNEHHIVKMLGYNEFPFFIYMECLNDDLASYAQKRKFDFSEKDLFKVCMDTLQGLISLEKFQIVHRDIKPRNLLVDFNGSDGLYLLYCLIKICDLGASRPINKYLMEMGSHGELTKDVGTPGYMCPEVTALLGDKDSSGLYSFKSDVWSLATSLLYLHTGGGKPFTEPVLKALNSEINTDERRDKEIESILESNVQAEEIPQLLYLMKLMLKWNENDRISADACLKMAECLQKQELAATPAKAQASAKNRKANPINVPSAASIPKRKKPSTPADQHNPSNEDQLSRISLGKKYEKSTDDFIEDYKRGVNSRKIRKIVMPPRTSDNKSMYVERQLVEMKTNSTRKVRNDNEQRHVSENIEDFFVPGRPCLVKGEAGMGKSYLSGHLLSQWADGNSLVDSSLCIILMCRGIDQHAKRPLSELIYEYSSMSLIQSSQSIEKITYKELSKLAKHDKLTVILEGLDEVRNIKRDELNKIKENVYRAVNENQTLSCIDLIVGILVGELLQNSNIIATGRHISVDSVKENILDEEGITPIIVHLMEFNDANVIQLVHRLTCRDKTECIELPEGICQDIIKIFKGNQTAKTMSANPSSCTELIKLFNKSGDQIVFESSNACTLVLDMILRNLHHSHNQESTSKHSFTTLKADTKKDLHELVKLCWNTLFNGDYEIRGTLKTEKDDEIYIVPDINKQIKIRKENIDKMQVFKQTERNHGRVSLEPIYLLCLEILSAGYSFLMDKEIVLKKLNALDNIDRIEAILVHIASFVKKETAITENFLTFMHEASNEQATASNCMIDRETLMQDIYTFVLNLPNLPKVHSRKKIQFSCFVNEKSVPDSNIFLLAKLVATSGVKCENGLSVSATIEDQDKFGVLKNMWSKMWSVKQVVPVSQIVFDNPGANANYITASEARNILTFLEVQGDCPREVHIKERAYGGMLSVMKTFMMEHPDVKLEMSSALHRPMVELYSSSDVESYFWLVSNEKINPENLSFLQCSVKVDNSISHKVLPAMLKVAKIMISTDQTTQFWTQTKDKLLEGGHKVTQLSLARLSSIPDITWDCFVAVPEGSLYDMKIEKKDLAGLQDRLTGPVSPDTHKQIDKLVLVAITFDEETVPVLSECMTCMEKISLVQMKLGTSLCKPLAEALQSPRNKTVEMTIQQCQVEPSAIESFVKCVVSTKEVRVFYMKMEQDLCKQLAEGLEDPRSKTEVMGIYECEVEPSAIESFVKCVVSTKEVRLSLMKLKEEQWTVLVESLNNCEENKNIIKITVKTSIANKIQNKAIEVIPLGE